MILKNSFNLTVRISDTTKDRDWIVDKSFNVFDDGTSIDTS